MLLIVLMVFVLAGPNVAHGQLKIEMGAAMGRILVSIDCNMPVRIRSPSGHQCLRHWRSRNHGVVH